MDTSRFRALPWLLIAIAAPAATAPPLQSKAYFTSAEREAVMAYWSEPGRYEALPAGETKGVGRWQARYTAAGSTWIRELYRLRGDGKVVPTSAPPATTEQQRKWDAWVELRVQYDKWLAETEANKNNAIESGKPEPKAATPPQDPGAMPEDLAAVLPVPPPFYTAVVPMAHRITFDDTAIAYEDNVTVPHKYAYYRFEQGVRSGGIKMADRAAPFVSRILERAQIGDFERKVFNAVSMLEGGFDSVNTYDTGFVSVGFIQFAALSGGSGSLGAVLNSMKTNSPEAFNEHFRRFGIDVTEEGVLVVLDPALGVQFVGPDANQRIIADKRLVAVFQRAGRLSEDFCVAQLAIARQLYYPAEDLVSLDVNGKTLSCKVSDIFKSEAGLATLMDRKVNTGKLEGLEDFLYDLVTQTKIEDLREASKFEWALVRVMKYRTDFLTVSSLSQPTRADITLSRGNNPRDRRGGG